MCIQEIESSLTKCLMFLSVLVIQDFMMQIYLVARCDKSWTRLRIIYQICVVAGVSVLQGQLMIRQCHSDTNADVKMYWLDFCIAAYFSLVNVLTVIYTSQALSDKIGDREKTVMKIKVLGAIL